MLSKIKRYQEESSPLELGGNERNHLLKVVNGYVEAFLNHEPINRIYHAGGDDAKAFDVLTLNESPEDITTILSLIKKFIVDPGLDITSPGFMGYIPGGGLYPSALGDFIAAVTNRFAGLYCVSPGATRLDNLLIRWMSHLVGYSKLAGGNLSSGGSLANFIAIVTAREAYSFKSKDFSRLVIYTTSQAHYSIFKGLRLAGLKEALIRYIPIDHTFCLQPHVLKQMIQEDKRKGRIPWLIITTFGTTNTGSIDPLEETVDLAKKNNLWLHVDAAYGGFFLLCPVIKKKYAIIREANSITIDPHKGLFIPYGLGVILTQKEDTLRNAYDYEGVDYLPNLHQGNEEISPASLSPELSVHFRGLRMWLPLKLFGIKPFQSALEEKLLLAQYFYQQLLKLNRIEVVCQPMLSIVVFRFSPKNGDPNKINQMIFEKIKQHGKVFFSTTFLYHKLYLRMACLNYKTHLDAIQSALEELKHFISAYQN